MGGARPFMTRSDHSVSIDAPSSYTWKFNPTARLGGAGSRKRVERRLAAILAVDVVGHSRMRREDETGTLAPLKTLGKELLDPRVEECGRRIVETTGDGVLVEFASAVDAVQNAVNVRRALTDRNSDVH